MPEPLRPLTVAEVCAISAKDPDEVTNDEVGLLIFTLGEYRTQANLAIHHLRKARMVFDQFAFDPLPSEQP